MKKYTLKVYNGGTTEIETITAETHTIDNGVYIFWVRNNKGEWAQIAMWPSTNVAITRIQPEESFAVATTAPSATNITTNPTIDISEFINNGIEELKEVASKTKTRKK